MLCRGAGPAQVHAACLMLALFSLHDTPPCVKFVCIYGLAKSCRRRCCRRHHSRFCCHTDVVARVEAALGGKLDEPPLIHLVRDVAPNKVMLCVSFKVPAAVAFHGRQQIPGAGADCGQQHQQHRQFKQAAGQHDNDSPQPDAAKHTGDGAAAAAAAAVATAGSAAAENEAVTGGADAGTSEPLPQQQPAAKKAKM